MGVSNLQAFLLESSREQANKTVRLHGRLKDFEFVIKGLTLNELQEARRRSINQNASGDGRLDPAETTAQTIIAGCVSPNFKDADFIAQAGVQTPSQCVLKLLLAGEANELGAEILKASGIGVDEEDQVEKARQEAKD